MNFRKCILGLAVVIAPLLGSSLAIAAPDSSCGADPNPVYSIQSLIESCTRQAHETDRHYIPNMGFMAGASPDQRAWGYYRRGLLYQFNHQDDLAIGDYTSALDLNRHDGDAYAARADAYEETGDHAHAVADYAQAAAMNTDNAGDLDSRCWVRAIRGHPLDLALADCDLSLKLHPDSVDTLDSRCFVHYRMGEYAAAISDCDQVLAREPGAASSLYVRGLAKLGSGDATGGNADIAAAKSADYRIAETYAVFGVKP
jgi:tetratricopeptide (TPR) repeat protein